MHFSKKDLVLALMPAAGMVWYRSCNKKEVHFDTEELAKGRQRQYELEEELIALKEQMIE